MDIRKNYEAGKTAKDYYHEFMFLVPNEMWEMLGTEANSRNKPKSSIVRGYIFRGLEKDGYDISKLISF